MLAEPCRPGALELIQSKIDRLWMSRRPFDSSGPYGQMVGAIGFEPTTSWSQTRRSTRLSYAPKKEGSKEV